MIALCGSCMHRLRASVRWERAPAPEPALATGTTWAKLVEPLMRACDGCACTPISPRFPHAVFLADRADLSERESA